MLTKYTILSKTLLGFIRINPWALNAVCCLLLAAYIFPYIYYANDATLTIHDNLDAQYVWYKTLLDSGGLFKSNGFLINGLNGLPRGVFPFEFDPLVFMYATFGPYGAYVLNRVIATAVGFLGMYLLLKIYIVPAPFCQAIHSGVALCFATLPFLPFAGLSVAGMPLVAFALLNLRGGKSNWYNWLILLIYSFYSSLIFVGVFLLITFTILLIVDLVNKKNVTCLFFGLLFLSLAYLLTHYRLFSMFLMEGAFVSHRIEFGSVIEMGIKRVTSKAIMIFLHGQYHAHSLHDLIILPVVSFVFIYSIVKRKFNAYFFYAVLFLVITAAWYGLVRWSNFDSIKSQIYSVLPMQLDRFYFLYPMVWMSLFAFSLSIIYKIRNNGKYIVFLIVIIQICYHFSFHELWINRSKPTVSEFFAKKQFSQIDSYIGKPKSEYKVVSLGLHPSIALYNGFYTFDGYFSSYPLKHKRAFRKVIAGELDRNEKLKRYYDNWGSRAYLFSSELYDNKFDFNDYLKGSSFEISKLELNAEELIKNKVSYLISAFKINATNNKNFTLEKKFISNDSAWDIYLYKINSDSSIF